MRGGGAGGSEGGITQFVYHKDYQITGLFIYPASTLGFCLC